MALAIAGPGAMAPLSPAPLMPSSLMIEGWSIRAVVISGRSSALGIALLDHGARP